MPKITFIQPDGKNQTIDASTGLSLMEAAVKGNVRGIDADCGGACSCATCHVYVADDWVDRLAPREEMETTMLEFAVNPDDTSRLSCQIKVSEAIDGLTVRIPASQR